jgi:hypothetical protein
MRREHGEALGLDHARAELPSLPEVVEAGRAVVERLAWNDT